MISTSVTVREETNLKKIADRELREGEEKEVVADGHIVARHSVQSDFNVPHSKFNEDHN